ncbi:DUF2853 family protein [Manganibacter manganicus]|uniref:DUF2853 domain-containing protein n=1 Tax=Manganibacter manganicus TaxID=1873176 RepID=A0A1V8RMT6_9HYPH|nr:DUF2853 family protein [Pseudaminobacter manganicus]OQM74511.1 hypothetical protein BFN67_21465 [Pseudaminobacter manganicus]
MSRRDDLIAKYAADLKGKCGVTPDLDLLTKVTIACGPSIYQDDASIVAASDKAELETIKKRFLIGKLGLKEGPELDKGLSDVIDQYGRSNRNKYRAVVYYLLAIRFKREKVYT